MTSRISLFADVQNIYYTCRQEFGRHFALSCPIGEFEALKARLVENGAKLIAPGRDTPFERFFFSSPEGYVFEIIEAEKFQDNIDQLFQESGKE